MPAKSKQQSTGGESGGDPALAELIRAEIARQGLVTFAWFMEQALYHPQHGYYSSGRAKIGRAGDYFTSVSVGPLFGRLMAAQFAEIWEALGRPAEFTVVEQGAHGGDFARDVLSSACEHTPAFFDALRYQIVEPFAALRSRQSEALAAFASKVDWRESLDALEPFCGVHFSNELIDAMPVHRVRWNGSEWVERAVGWSGESFAFSDAPIRSDLLAKRVREIALPLPSGYETEINLAARDWIAAVAQKLASGFVVAVDYGYPRDGYFAEHRTSGTLQSYANHRVLASPLLQPGRSDISAHVEWTSLAEHAQACGLTTAGFTDQHHFITGLLAGAVGREFEDVADAATKRALHTLMHPTFLGMTFQFLVLGRNADTDVRLSGLRFVRPARAALGLV